MQDIIKGKTITLKCNKKELRRLEIIIRRYEVEEQGNAELLLADALNNIRAGLYTTIKFEIE